MGDRPAEAGRGSIWVIGIRYGHIGWRDIAQSLCSVLGVEILATLQANVDNLVVGAFLGIEALGVYYLAFNADLGITVGVINLFGMALYPHLCEARGDSIGLAKRYREGLRTLGGIVAPIVVLQAALAPIYVPIVFGARWKPAISVLMLICLSALPRPFAAACSQLLRAVGRTDIELRWELALTARLVPKLAVGTRFGIIGVAAAVRLVQGAVSTAYMVGALRRLLGGMPSQPLLRPWTFMKTAQL